MKTKKKNEKKPQRRAIRLHRRKMRVIHRKGGKQKKKMLVLFYFFFVFVVFVCCFGFVFRQEEKKNIIIIIMPSLERTSSSNSSAGAQNPSSWKPSHPSASPEKFLDEMLSSNPVLLISATYCTFCTRLKALLVELRVKFVVLEINVMPNGRGVFEEVVYRSQCHSVPQVFIRSEYVGGYDDIITLHHKGELMKLIQK